MVTRYNWEQNEVVITCEWYDSDAYIGCKLKENGYYRDFKKVKVLLESKSGEYKLYAEDEDIMKIGKLNQYRLLPGGHGEGYYEDYIGIKDCGWILEDRYKRPLKNMSLPPQVIGYRSKED